MTGFAMHPANPIPGGLAVSRWWHGANKGGCMHKLNGKEAHIVRVDVYPATGQRVEHFSNGVSFTSSMTAADYQSVIIGLYATIQHMRKEATNANK